MPKKKPTYQLEDDDLDSLTKDEGDVLAREVIVSKYMEDIAEILSQAYSDIDDKVHSLLEDLEEK